MTEPATALSRHGRRARAAVLWGLLTLGLAQVGLLVALERYYPELCDPEYGFRLGRLHERQKEAPKGQPLLVLLGSSRVGLGFRPQTVSTSWQGQGTAPTVINFGMASAGPLLELLVLKRMLADGVRPTW